MQDFSRRDLTRLAALGLAGGALAGKAAAQAVAGTRLPTLPANAAGLGTDHIVFAVPDLDKAVAFFRDATGVEPVSGGLAPGRSQPHNALVALGGGTYLEIISPVRAQMKDGPWLAAIEDGHPHIIDFAQRVTDRFQRVQAAFRANNVAFLEPTAMSRTPPGGPTLSWETLRTNTPFADYVPFFIDWHGSRPHPSESSNQGVTIHSFHIAHPDAEGLSALYRKIGVDVAVVKGERPGRYLLLDTPKGQLLLA